jgi:hypothetical protein
MQKLFENFRTFLNEAGDPDSNDDNLPNPEEVAKALERSTIENAIQDASFNSAQSSQHRWSPRQPIVDYNFNDRLGVWTYMASIPDGTNDADNWPVINSKKGEDIDTFLVRVGKPHQLNLGLKQDEKLFENITGVGKTIATDAAKALFVSPDERLSDFKIKIADHLASFIKNDPVANDILGDYSDDDYKRWLELVKSGKSSIDKIGKEIISHINQRRAQGDGSFGDKDVEPKEDIFSFMKRAYLQGKFPGKKIKKSRSVGVGVIVNCPNGNCLDQMIANEHAPWYSRGELRSLGPSKMIKLFPERYPESLGKVKRMQMARAELKTFKKALRTDVGGTIGVRKMKTGNMLPGGIKDAAKDAKEKYKNKEIDKEQYKQEISKIRKKGLDAKRNKNKIYSVLVHSSTTKSAWKTAASLSRGGLSINFEIERDGTIYKYFDPSIRTVHGEWVNRYSIGVELTGKHKSDSKYKGHTKEQVQSLKILIAQLEKDHDLLPVGKGYKVIPQSAKLRSRRAIVNMDAGVVAHASTKGPRTDPGASVMSALEESRLNSVSMNSLFENWRGYISESLDPGILESIVENIESVIEIPVRKVYKSSLINESEGVSVKVQLAGFYTDKLMKMISERWINSKERSTLQEQGYNIEIIPDGNSLDENYILLTRELL